jgi:hypothetical protein
VRQEAIQSQGSNSPHKWGIISVSCFCGERLLTCSTNAAGITAQLICKCGAVAKFNHSFIPEWDDLPLPEVSHSKSTLNTSDQK